MNSMPHTKCGHFFVCSYFIRTIQEAFSLFFSSPVTALNEDTTACLPTTEVNRHKCMCSTA